MSEELKEVVVKWRGGKSFIGSNGKGGSVQLGTAEGEPGLSPMELLLIGLAGCTGIDVALILEKKRQKLVDFQVKVQGKRASDHPRIYTDIEVSYHLWGEELDAKAVEQAIQLSEDKYCSASAMLGASARIASSYEIFQV